MEDQKESKKTVVDVALNNLMGIVCDQKCKHVGVMNEEELFNECANCGCSKYVCEILNEYNALLQKVGGS